MGDNTPAQVLMRKGKRVAASHVHNDCANNTPTGLIGEMLDILLNPSKVIDEWETLDWIKWLMAGGRTPDEFSSIVRRYDNATTCGLVWTANFVAYRCRTCGISPCMSLCAECFQKGDHDGHDFNMFRSQAGGACDCGDTSVMKETGFCDKHGPRAQVNKPCVPSDLMCSAEAIMPRLILRLIQHLRENSKNVQADAHIVAIMDADNFLTMLHEMSAMGAAMRRVMTASLTNPQLYKHLTECCESPYMAESQRVYQDALKGLPNPEPPLVYKDCLALQQVLVHRTFLEELVFWTVRFEFPQKVVCLLLNMLPDPDYKEALTQAFVLHYSRISMMLERSTDPDTLSNRVVHVSVQLFSNEALALRMVDGLNLLHVMVTSLKYMMSKILIPNTLHGDNNRHWVVDCGLQVMKEHCYWPLVSDLNNVLSHRPVAVRFMSDDMLLDMWFDFLSMFQGMNVNQREMAQHVEFEPNTYYAAFSAELEASAYPMWALLSHLRDTDTLELTQRVLASCLTALRQWLDCVNMTQPNVRDSDQVSFHLPLHRYLSVFMCQAINVQGMSLEQVLPPRETLHLIMMHPLRVQVAFYEILNGLWVRNGLQIKGQAMTYIQCNFCNSMVDADIYLLQLCATRLPADVYLNTVIDKFHMKDWLSLGRRPQTPPPDTEPETPMLESCLTFLASLISLRTNLGETGARQCALSQLEMVTLLCMCDKTHSQLMELMPERCGTAQSRDFESVLTEVADYKAPNLEASGNMQQGMYVPKARVWEQLYDPIHVLLRAVHRRDFQTSMDRFTEYAQQVGRIRSGSVAWPPFRTPGPVHAAYQDPRRVLGTRVFHALVWLVLYKAVAEHTVSEHVMAVLIYLLEQAIAVSDPHQPDQMCPAVSAEPRRQVRDAELTSWYDTDWLSANLRTPVQSVLPASLSPFDCDSDSDNEWVDKIRGGSSQEAEPDPSPVTHLALEDWPNALVPVTFSQPAIGDSEPMEALPPSTQPLSLLAGTEMVAASSFTATRQPPPCPHALPGPSGSRALQLAKRTLQPRSMYTPAPVNSGVSQLSVELPSPGRSVDVNESIISLLLKLHSHLSGTPDSFNPDEPELDRDSRIGDGPFFVGKVLHRIMELDSFCREYVVQTRERLWPRQPEEGESERREREERERAERRRKAKERQQKLMEEFASKQKQFMEKAMETDEDGMEWDGAEQVLTTKKEYDCVICSQTSPSTEDKPMGLAVLVQATSVLGHKRRSDEPAELPVSDEERQRLLSLWTLAADFDRRIEQLDTEFDKLSWLVSVNLGWEGGVHVQTCGHHLHLDCLKSYLRSLRNQQRLSSERGEYSCPLCRRLANSVLPLPPQLGECAAVVRSRPATLNTTIGELIKFLKENPPSKPVSPVTTNLMEAMSKSMEDMTNSTYLKFKQKSGTRHPQTLFLFVSSIARTNLEVELVQREGSLCAPKSTECIPKRSCIMPLLHVLAVHARLLAVWTSWETFQLLAGVTEPPSPSPTPALITGNQVPLLLTEPSALLTQFILLLPLHLDQTYFTCLVRLLYNLLYMQVTMQLTCAMSVAERARWRRDEAPTSVATLDDALALVLHSMDGTPLYVGDQTPAGTAEIADREELENQIQSLCLPFLRIAALLRHHLYEQELPKIHDDASEFVVLVYHLELVEGGMPLEQFNAAVALSWPEPWGCHMAAWSCQLAEFVNRSQVAARSLLSEQHVLWHQPRLLSLPELYDRIFQYYHRRQCGQCHSVPRETSICLVCGTLVCLKENCCKHQNVCEAVQHSVDCGAGTAMYLVVTSSYVIVIRGKRACLWGSVYLDSFGEEDRELKRGKPLYLSPGRYQLLQQQWLGHHFDHTPKKWVWHREAL